MSGLVRGPACCLVRILTEGCEDCRKEVTSLSVHPSGLLALSTARDDMLRMWNMTKGRSQYKTKIPSGTEAVSFSPNGDIYALLSGLKVRTTQYSSLMCFKASSFPVLLCL
jgi:WD40 repeat protein